MFAKAEPYLELSRASMMAICRKNSKRLSVIFAKDFTTDVQLGSKYASEKTENFKVGQIIAIVTKRSVSCFSSNRVHSHQNYIFSAN